MLNNKHTFKSSEVKKETHSLKMDMCKIFTVCCLLITTVAVEHSKAQGNCIDLVCTYHGKSGDIFIDRNASLMTHVIDVRNASSIIELVIFPANRSEIIKTSITIQIKENNREKIKKLSPNDTYRFFDYVSSSPNFNISFAAEEEWLDLYLIYQELEFDILSSHIKNDSGMLNSEELYFQPNTMTIYNILPDTTVWNESSVWIMVKQLNLDDLSGDYMLIGAGKEVFKGPPAVFLTSNISRTDPKKYYVDANEVYIAVLHLSERAPKFEVEWIRIGSRVKPPEKETKKDISDSTAQAMPICFYNRSWIDEFAHPEHDDSPLALFKSKFADAANRYIKKKKMMNYMEKISPTSVQIVHISSIIPDNENLPQGAIYAMVTIVHSYDKKLAVFRWQQMEEIISIYEAQDGYDFGFKVGKCPTRKRYNWWYVAAALLIIFSTTFFVGVWICTYNHTWKKRKLKKEDILDKHIPKLQSQSRRSRELNHVAYINPTITITDEDGENVSIGNSSRKYTNVQSDEDSETEVFNSNWIMRRKSSPAESSVTKELPGQIHLFKSPSPPERVNPSSLIWFKDNIGNSFGINSREQTTYAEVTSLQGHEPIEDNKNNQMDSSETKL